MEWPFGFLTPAVEYRYRSYQLTNADDQLNPEVDLDRTLSAPRYSVDAGLFFERDLSLFGTWLPANPGTAHFLGTQPLSGRGKT